MSETVIIGPDGARYVFPAGVTPEKMREAMRRRYRRGEYYQRMDRGREMIMGSNVRDRSGAQMAAGQYLAEDQLRQDIEAGRQQAQAEQMIAEPDIGRERFMSAAQGLTLGAAPYLQGGAQGLAAGVMFPFLSPEQRERLGGQNIGDVVGAQTSRGYQTARADIERAREARPLESLGLELVGGFGAIKSIYDDIGQRYFRNQAGVRGGISGAGGGAQYGVLESEGSPEETAIATTAGGIGGAGIAKALQATAGPVGQLYNRMMGRQPEPDMVPEPGAEPTAPGAGYFNRQSMRAARDRGPSERVMAMQAEWQPLQANMGNARAAATEASRLAQQATNLRGADRQTVSAQAGRAMQAVRAQIADVQAQRGGMSTPEDQRLQDIIDLLEPTSDPVQLQSQATVVNQNLNRINEALGLRTPTDAPLPPQPTAARRLGFQPTVRDETAVAGPRPVAGRYAAGADDTTPQGFAGIGPNAFVEAGIGSVGGSVAGQQYDITGDGVIDERDMQAGALMGMAGVPLAARMMRGGGSGMRGMGYTGEASATTSNLDSLGFSSIALEAARALPDRAMRPEEAINRILKSRGVEGTTGKVKDEVEFLGLKNAFSGRERVTKQEIIEYIQANRFGLGMLEFQENSPSGLRVGDKYDLDDDPDIVRREFVLTLPENVAGGEYVGAHTNIKGDLINILASDRVDDLGQKTLFIRQLQSDLAQRERNSIKVKMEKGESVPPLTKKTSQWTTAGVQAMLMRAAKEGYDSISFPTASTSEIIQGNADAASFYETNVKSALEKAARAHNGKVRKGRVGYDLETDVDEGGWGIQFDDETNSWMAINELGTEFKDGFGSRKEAREWLDRMGSTEEGGAEVYIIDITPEMKKSLEQKGFPLFAGLPFAVGGAGLGMGAMQEEE